jgi:flagellar L-ring protein precursor FlgH
MNQKCEIKISLSRWMAFFFSFILLTTGCAESQKLVKEARSPVIPETLYPKMQARLEGSLWPGETYENMLAEDAKAKRVGDLLTIILNENINSSQTATTQSKKDASMGLQTGTLLGLPSNLGIQSLLGSGSGFNPNLDAKTSRSIDGQGTTTRKGILTGTISAMITEVFPNGNLRILGKRIVNVNSEEQVMIIKGIVRPADINFNNTVNSTQIAEADINYVGQGVLADDQRVGWGYKFLSWVWPF